MSITETAPKPVTLESFAAAVAKYKDSELTNAKLPGQTQGCTYVVRQPNGVPIEGHRHCIAGQALADLGFFVPDDAEGSHFGDLVDRKVAPFAGTTDELAALVDLGLTLQGEADNGQAWGICISETLEADHVPSEARAALRAAIEALPHTDMQDCGQCMTDAEPSGSCSEHGWMVEG